MVTRFAKFLIWAVFNPDTGESYSTNFLAVKLFNMLKEEKTFEEISKEVMNNYHVDQTTFEKDFNDFIVVLDQYNLSENDGS